MLFVIENLEPKLSEWLFIEYSHAAKIVGRRNLMITNVKNPSELKKLKKIARAESGSITDLFARRELIVLDPEAEKDLVPKDFREKSAVIIGGILGDDPPRKRTGEMLTKRLPGAAARRIGERQFSIDSSVYVASQVFSGKSLEEIPSVFCVEIPLSKHHSIELPYEYPLVDGKPLIAKKLLAYVKRRGDIFR